MLRAVAACVLRTGGRRTARQRDRGGEINRGTEVGHAGRSQESTTSRRLRHSTRIKARALAELPGRTCAELKALDPDARALFELGVLSLRAPDG
jgi:hypothetical protein